MAPETTTTAAKQAHTSRLVTRSAPRLEPRVGLIYEPGQGANREKIGPLWADPGRPRTLAIGGSSGQGGTQHGNGLLVGSILGTNLQVDGTRLRQRSADLAKRESQLHAEREKLNADTAVLDLLLHDRVDGYKHIAQAWGDWERLRAKQEAHYG